MGEFGPGVSSSSRTLNRSGLEAIDAARAEGHIGAAREEHP